MAFLGSIGKAFTKAVKAAAPVVAPIATMGTDIALAKLTGGAATGGFGGATWDMFGNPFVPQPVAGVPMPRPPTLPAPRPMPRPPGRPGPPVPMPMPPFPSPPGGGRGPGGVPIPVPIPFGGSIARAYCSQIRMSYWTQTGHRLPSMGKIKGMIRTCGLEQTAGALGISVEVLCRFLLLCKPRKRPLVRRSDLKACRRVVGSLSRLQHLVASLRVGRGSPVRGRRRRCPACRKNPCQCA